MKCSQCGATYKRGSSFCGMCGSDLPPSQPISLKPFFMRLGLVCACLVVLVMLLSFVPRFFSPSVPATNGFMFFQADIDCTATVYNDHVLDTTAPAAIQSPRFNLNQTIGVATTAYSISFITPDEVSTVNTSVSCYAISPAGDYVAYVNASNCLILRDVPAKTETEIAAADKIDNLVISPDGQALSYRVVAEDSSYLAVYANGAVQSKVLPSCTPIGISDGAELLYCYDETANALSVSHNQENPVLLSMEPGGTYQFNRDHTQILFNAGADRLWYVSKQGEAPHKLAIYADDFAPLLPRFVPSVTNTHTTYNIKTFANQYYYSADRSSLCYVNSRWSSKQLTQRLVSSAVCVNPQTIFFSTGQTLYRISGRKAKPVTDEQFPSAMISAYMATSDGKDLFYLTAEDGSLYYAKKGNRPKQIATQVKQIYMSHDDNLFFRAPDENGITTLYCLKNNSKPEPVCSNIISFSVGPKVTCYTSAEGLFCASRSPKFKLIRENIGAYIASLP